MRHNHNHVLGKGQLQLLSAGRGDVRRGRVGAAAGPQVGLLLANGTYRVHDPVYTVVRAGLYLYHCLHEKSAPREIRRYSRDIDILYSLEGGGGRGIPRYRVRIDEKAHHARVSVHVRA